MLIDILEYIVRDLLNKTETTLKVFYQDKLEILHFNVRIGCASII